MYASSSGPLLGSVKLLKAAVMWCDSKQYSPCKMWQCCQPHSHLASAILTGCIVPIVEGCYETFRNSVDLKINENRVCGCELSKAPKMLFSRHTSQNIQKWLECSKGGEDGMHQQNSSFFGPHSAEASSASSFHLGNTQHRQYNKVEKSWLQEKSLVGA